MGLLEQTKAAIAEREKRCQPSCPREAWRDEQVEADVVRTTCGTCGAFIGYRYTGQRAAPWKDAKRKNVEL